MEYHVVNGNELKCSARSIKIRYYQRNVMILNFCGAEVPRIFGRSREMIDEKFVVDGTWVRCRRHEDEIVVSF